MDGLPGYDNWKTSPPEYDDGNEMICMNRKCRFQGAPEDFGYNADEERCCPECGGVKLETLAERDERLRDDYWQAKLDERRGK